MGPYRQHIPATQFPVYHPTTSASYEPAVFSRSLMPLGHGFPLWRPGTSLRPEAHFMQGISIGDVGFIGSEGDFQYRFNIFYPPDHPMQPPSLPRTFRHVEPPLSDWEVRSTTDHFSAGTVLTSAGIRYSQLSTEPQYVMFTFQIFLYSSRLDNLNSNLALEKVLF